jgi:quercetin dioxygenase-like cupin family protein
MAYPRKERYLIRPDDGNFDPIPNFGGVRYLVDGEEGGQTVAIVEHPVEPKGSSGCHTHSHEDEYSFVIEGTIGVLIGDEEFRATAGDLVLKPRGIPHMFWNPTDKPAKVLEIISPAGLEKFFVGVGEAQRSGGTSPQTLGPLLARHGIAMDFARSIEVADRHGLKLAGNTETMASGR